MTAPMITVQIPYSLSSYCDGARELSLTVPSVRAALDELERRYPALYLSICDETGAVRRHVNLFVNTSHIRQLAGLDTSLESGDAILVLPAVSGG